MTALISAALAGLGVFYLYTGLALGWRGAGFTTGVEPHSNVAARRLTRVHHRGGHAPVEAHLAVAAAVLFALGWLAAFALLGGVMPAAVVGATLACAPVAAHTRMQRQRLEAALQAWPGMIDEIRVLTGAGGKSIPQALFDVGRRAPTELRLAFERAHREWLLTTDFERTLDTLKAGLADPTADAVCETLLIAHRLGGSDLESRLAALQDDRSADLQDRKDAGARQAGARFARLFTVAVPVGMLVVGMSIGEGRQAYATQTGQYLVTVAVAMVIACWIWAGRLMRLPEPRRVFAEETRR